MHADETFDQLDRKRRSAQDARQERRTVIDAQSGGGQRLSPPKRASPAPHAERSRAGERKDERTFRERRLVQLLGIVVVAIEMDTRRSGRLGKVTMHDRRMMPVTRVMHVLDWEQDAADEREERHKGGRSGEAGLGQLRHYAGPSPHPSNVPG